MLWTGQDALLNASRQSGKTQVVSLRAAYRAAHFDLVVGCLGPTTRQTSRMSSCKPARKQLKCPLSLLV